MTALSRGSGETFSVFLLPLSGHFGWERASVASIYSIYMVCIGFGSLLAGVTFDRWGARFNYLVGTAMLAVTYLVAGRLQELWHYYLVLGAGAGMGASMIGLVPMQSLVARWYHRRLSTALSVGYASQGLGTLMLVPLVQVFIEVSGWRNGYQFLGLAFAGMFLLVLAMPWKTIEAGARENPLRTKDGRAVGGLSLRQAAAGRAFWGFFGIFSFTAVGIFGISLQSVAYLIERGYSELEAAFAFGVVGMLSFAGMVLTGVAAEFWPKHIVASISYLLSLCGIVALALLQVHLSAALLFIYIVGLGLSSGARGPIITTIMTELFSGKGLASIYGAANVGQGVGAALGAFTTGLLYDLTGAYNAGFLFCSLSLLCGLMLFWVVPEIRHAASCSQSDTADRQGR